MAEHLVRRSEFDPNCKDVTINTDLSEQQLSIIEEIRELEQDESLKVEWAQYNRDAINYFIHHRIPYGCNLTAPEKTIWRKIKESKIYIESILPEAGSHLTTQLQVMQKIHDKIEELLLTNN